MRCSLFLALLLAFTLPLIADDSVTFDKSGNGLLKGVYNFRHVAWQVGTDNTGNLGKAVALYGTITFDGNGNYNVNASVWDSRNASVQTLTAPGTYIISASGLGQLSSTLFADGVGIYGLVSQGIFIGSSTDEDVKNSANRVNDIFIAAPAAISPPAIADFKGSYWVSSMSFPALTTSQARDAFFQLTPDGQGGLGNVSLTGYIGNGPKMSQVMLGSVYSFTSGIAQLSFANTTTGQSLISAKQTMYMSPDGNLIFGGSDQGFDLFIGVRALAGSTSSSTFSGLYYHAGADLDAANVILDSYYGAFSAGNGNVVGHQRLVSCFDLSLCDYTYSDVYTLAADGTYDDFFGTHYVLGAGGAIRVGFGQEGFLGINVSLRAPSFSGPGVYLNPTGILNEASYTPFTVGVSPGELVALYGTNLAPDTKVDATFPTTLDGVQVLVNNRPAPIYVASPTQLSVLVPWATSGSVAAIQVINNGTASNTVTVFNSRYTPGFLTQSQNGLGDAAAVHQDGSLVTASSPARASEVISVFLTGLGAVMPAISDGDLGPVNPLSKTVDTPTVFVGLSSAVVSYAGLAPQLRGLYQLNITIPSAATTGEKFLNISGPFSYSSEATLSVVGRAGAASGEEQAVEESPTPRPNNVPRAELRNLLP
jgi:uncharacterized protein (TIGR03437 family)